MKRLIASLVALAGAVTLAGLYVPDDAATVGTASISRQSLDADLSAIAASPDYACFLYEQRMVATGVQAPVLGAGSGSQGVYGTAFVDGWLSSMVTQRAAALLVARLGRRLDAADMSAGRAVLTHQMTSALDQYARETGAERAGCGRDGAAVLASVPPWFSHQQVRAAADEALLAAAAARTTLSAGTIARYYDAHRLTYDRDCLSVIVVHTASQAAAAEASLSAGVPFGAEAAAVSLTRRSAAAGGAAGCGELAGTFLGPAAAALHVGSVSRPLHGDGLYWVVRLTGRSARSLQSVRATVLTAILAAGRRRADAELAREIRASKVTVDPLYGSLAAGATLLAAGATLLAAGATLLAAGTTLLAAPPSPPPTAQLSTGADEPPIPRAR